MEDARDVSIDAHSPPPTPKPPSPSPESRARRRKTAKTPTEMFRVVRIRGDGRCMFRALVSAYSSSSNHCERCECERVDNTTFQPSLHPLIPLFHIHPTHPRRCHTSHAPQQSIPCLPSTPPSLPTNLAKFPPIHPTTPNNGPPHRPTHPMHTRTTHLHTPRHATPHHTFITQALGLAHLKSEVLQSDDEEQVADQLRLAAGPYLLTLTPKQNFSISSTQLISVFRY